MLESLWVSYKVGLTGFLIRLSIPRKYISWVKFIEMNLIVEGRFMKTFKD